MTITQIELRDYSIKDKRVSINVYDDSGNGPSKFDVIVDTPKKMYIQIIDTLDSINRAMISEGYNIIELKRLNKKKITLFFRRALDLIEKIESFKGKEDDEKIEEFKKYLKIKQKLKGFSVYL